MTRFTRNLAERCTEPPIALGDLPWGFSFMRQIVAVGELVRPHHLPDHLLTFELAKDGDELFIHADAAGLRFLASALGRE